MVATTAAVVAGKVFRPPRLRNNAGMNPPKPYLSETEAPTRAEVETLPGLTLLEFGTAWCGHCRAAQPALVQELPQHPQWRHYKIEDGSGRPLGRSYRVKLWPTLVLLRDGQEVARLVRPTHAADIAAALNAA
jgi:thioredoxin 1